jgi:hypothetical protein
MPIGGRAFSVCRAATFKEVYISTTAGRLLLRDLEAFVEEDNLSMEMTVGRPIMQVLSYSMESILAKARLEHPEWDFAGHSRGDTLTMDVTTPLQRMSRVQAAVRDVTLTVDREDMERHEYRSAMPSMKPSTLEEVTSQLEKKIDDASTLGLTLGGRSRLGKILDARADCFRVRFDCDPPVRVAPLQVRVKLDAKPTKAQPRRYSPDDRAFLDRHTTELMEGGLVFKNHRSRWASSPRIVCKKEQETDPTADPRMTIDLRQVNERTEAMPWPMPMLEVLIGALEAAKFFFVLDWFRGCWQLPLHVDSQNLFTFVTHRGMYTPTRVPMGATDVVAYCQGVVDEIFSNLLRWRSRMAGRPLRLR